jgi:hypothetical protein
MKLSKLNHIFAGTLILSWSAMTSIAATGGREFLQYVPLTPFFGADSPSRDYLKFSAPYDPWAPSAPLPVWTEVVSYKQRLDLLKETERETQTLAPTADPKTNDHPFGGDKIIEVFETWFPKPQILQPIPSKIDSTEPATWFSIPEKPEIPQSQSIPTPSSPEIPGGVIRQPIQGGKGTVYLPTGTVPTPTPTAQPSSSVTYTEE